MKGGRHNNHNTTNMEWYKVRFGTTQDNQQWNVQASSAAEAEAKFKQTDYYKNGCRIFSVSKL